MLCEHCATAEAALRCGARVYCTRACAERAWLQCAARVGSIVRLVKQNGAARPWDIDYVLPTDYIDEQVAALERGTVAFAVGKASAKLAGLPASDPAGAVRTVAIEWTKAEAAALKRTGFNLRAARAASGAAPRALLLLTAKMLGETSVDPRAFAAFEAHFAGATTKEAFAAKLAAMPPPVRAVAESRAFKLREVSQLIVRGSQRLGGFGDEGKATPLQRFVAFLLDAKPRPGTRTDFGHATARYLVAMMNDGRPLIANGDTIVFDQFARAHPLTRLTAVSTGADARLSAATFAELERIAK